MQYEQYETIDTWELIDVAHAQWVCITVPMPDNAGVFDVEAFVETCEGAS